MVNNLKNIIEEKLKFLYFSNYSLFNKDFKTNNIIKLILGINFDSNLEIDECLKYLEFDIYSKFNKNCK
jgi:hypothetical protein